MSIRPSCRILLIISDTVCARVVPICNHTSPPMAVQLRQKTYHIAKHRCNKLCYGLCSGNLSEPKVMFCV